MEAKFHKNSNGFRPYKSCESAISQFTNYIYNGESKLLKQLYGMDIVPISYVQYKKPVMQMNSVCKYTESGRSKIHTDLECMNYETIKNIVENPFELEPLELNDVIIPKCAI